MFVVEISVQPPVVSAFSSFAEVHGLRAELSNQPIVTHTIDNAGVRQAVKEIGGIIYSFQGNSVFLTDVTTGATQSRTLTGLAGSTGIQVRDVALVNNEIVYVGGSLTGNAAPTKNSIPTMWDVNGTPTRIGPTGKTGIANFILDTGLIGGFYEKVSGEYMPWLHSDQGDFDLPGSTTPTNPQMVTGASSAGYYLIGFESNTPMVWQSVAAPETGDYELALSPDLPFEYPADATLTTAGKNFKILEDSSGTISIFGQFEIPIFAQGNITGYESHAGMWSLSGALLHDFGPNTEMLGVQVIGATYAVAHRDSISFVNFVNQLDVSTKPLDELLGSLPPVGTTRKILSNGLLLTGEQDAPKLGINFAEVGTSVTRNKIAILPLKTPDQVELDVNNDGVWDDVFFGFEMFAPSFVPLGYGQKTLAARVTYSDGSTANAVTTYEALPYESVSTGAGNELQIGGTAAADTATITLLANKSYRANIAGQTRDFQNIDNVLVRLNGNNDTLILAGGVVIDMTSLSDIEKIDTSATTAESISSLDATTVENQVGPTGTLLIKAGAEDSIELLPGWTLDQPQTIDGRATAKLTADGKTLLLQTGNYTNPLNNLDTTFDGFVSARDALLVINYINQIGGGVTPVIDAYLDVNNNGTISALDVLLIINDINSRGSGEGESSSAMAQQYTGHANDQSSVAGPLDLDDIANARKRRLS